MKVLFIVPSYQPAYVYGGTIIVVARLAEEIAKLGHEVSVYTTTANGRGELPVKPGEVTLTGGVYVTYFPRITGDHIHTSPALLKALFFQLRDFDIVHIHSWWNAVAVGAAFLCKVKRVYPILSPHGMFSDYILTNGNAGWKTILHKIQGKRLLKTAILHATSDMEANEIRQFLPIGPQAVIPNLVDLPALGRARRDNDVFTIGFLSRIDRKKGLDLLIQSLANVDFSYRLLVGGSGDGVYLESLKKLAESCGNADKIRWEGWKDSDQKFVFLAGLDLFALTSHNENSAIVVIESLAMGTPVFVSDQVGLKQYVEENNFGWVSEMHLEAITQALNEAHRDIKKRKGVVEAAPARVREDFDSENLARKYESFYQRVLGS